MTKYVFAYHGGNGMPETEEGQAELMATWGAWFASVGADLVDGGNPFGARRSVASDGIVGHGSDAFALTGYSIVNAVDAEAAVSVAKGCPVLANGGTVEVFEAVDM